MGGGKVKADKPTILSNPNRMFWRRVALTHAGSSPNKRDGAFYPHWPYSRRRRIRPCSPPGTSHPIFFPHRGSSQEPQPGLLVLIPLEVEGKVTSGSPAYTENLEEAVPPASCPGLGV